jgi:hypothetical protein
VNEYVLGRSSTCDVTVSHASVSSKHCRIWCEPPACHPSGCPAPSGAPLRVFLEDLSTNGTTVRTPAHQNVVLRKRQCYELRSGDEVSLVGRSGATSPKGPAPASAEAPTGATSISDAAATATAGGREALGGASATVTDMTVFMWCDLQGRRVEGVPAAAPELVMQPPQPRQNSGSSNGPRPSRVEDLYEVTSVPSKVTPNAPTDPHSPPVCC